MNRSTIFALSRARSVRSADSVSSGIDVESLSSTVPAQADFFRHVNGTWIDSYELPADKARYGSFDKLADDSEEQIHEIL